MKIFDPITKRDLDTNSCDLSHWNRAVDFSITHNVSNELLDIFIWSLSLKSGEVVWDFACWYWALSKRIFDTKRDIENISLVDISEFQLKRAKLNLNDYTRNWKVDFIQSPMQKTSFPNDKFDKIYCKMWLHELQKDAQRNALNELYRIIKPGGKLAVRDLFLPLPYQGIIQSIVRKKDEIAWFDTQVQNRYFFTQEEFESNARDAGFWPIDYIYDIYYRFSSFGRLYQELQWDIEKLKELNVYFRELCKSNLTSKEMVELEYEENWINDTLIRLPKKMVVLTKV